MICKAVRCWAFLETLEKCVKRRVCTSKHSYTLCSFSFHKSDKWIRTWFLFIDDLWPLLWSEGTLTADPCQGQFVLYSHKFYNCVISYGPIQNVFFYIIYHTINYSLLHRLLLSRDLSKVSCYHIVSSDPEHVIFVSEFMVTDCYFPFILWWVSLHFTSQ